MSSGLDYVLHSLKRASDNAFDWTVYPAEAGLLIAEIERLRQENEELKQERPSVVAWLRAKRNLMGDMPNKACRWADSIERGEHRREEEP